jgi:type IV pilus assembly protein PilQ
MKKNRCTCSNKNVVKQREADSMPVFQQQKYNNKGYSPLCIAVVIAGLLLGTMPSSITLAQEPSAAQQTETTAQQQDTAQQQEKNSIKKISAQQVGQDLEITLFGTKAPIQTPFEQPGSGRKGILVTIADAEVQNPDSLQLPENFHIGLQIKPMNEGGQKGIRFEFSLPKPFVSYATKVEGNNVVLQLKDFFQEDAVPDKEVDTASPEPESGGEKKAAVDNTVKLQLPKVDPLQNTGNKNSPPSAAKSESNVLVGNGKSDLVTVDFYKIDLHNVFRMLGEISGDNIIVAEGVSGTLTLSLNEVPWEFALDIILNLKDLTKQQQNNTIVIYPKDKEFTWPKREQDSLVIDTGNSDTGKEDTSSIVISRQSDNSQTESAHLVEAKKFLSQALEAEKNGDLETAVQFYSKALDEWPAKAQKSRLANKIAAIYLAELHQNAKAVYFAKKALAADKKNTSAALNVAIGYANMQENSQAQQYFDRSISVKKPSKEALFNYAIFSERLKQYEAALRLLSRHDELYGENLDSMVARARILDQQGHRREANQVYMAILHAGFSVPQDLRTFIIARIKSN